MDFEVANVDEVEVSSDARWTRGRIVLIRAPFKGVVTSGRNKLKYSVVLLAGISSDPEDFAELVPDFEGLLDRLLVAPSKKKLAHVAPAASSCRPTLESDDDDAVEEDSAQETDSSEKDTPAQAGSDTTPAAPPAADESGEPPPPPAPPAN